MKHQSRQGHGRSFPIVGIGASAGGLKAFGQLLSSLPLDTGMGFVLFPHLAPQYESHLAEILARTSRLPIRTVRGGELVLPDQVYIVPPNREMSIEGGVLRLRAKSGRSNPIDGFFASLAKDQGPRAIGILLSGEGSDGTKGLQAIKAGGGTTFAQDEKTAAHQRMPQTAARSGCVDFVLPPAEIARRLGHRRVKAAHPRRAGSFRMVLALLQAAKGVEFDLYKQSMLRRRILRRMALSRISQLESYACALAKDPVELDALYRDLLISVTSFFREPDAFRALKSQVYPRLLKRGSAKPVRIWVPGCSTGQEAYSHAINLSEFLDAKAVGLPFQIFATDVNAAAIRQARAGLYPKELAAELAPGRLRRFFIETEGGYQVAPAIRERCVFARQNLAQDPSFSNMDLISCRNLLIYLGPLLQEKALRIFHYALKPGGVLMLGRSETVGDMSERFSTLDAKRKLYSKRASPAQTDLEAVVPSRFPGTQSVPVSEHGPLGEGDWSADPADPQGGLADILPARFRPDGVIVNGELEILRFIGDTTSYLRPLPGKPGLNLRRMASAELLLELRAALYMAKKSGASVRKTVAPPRPAGTRPRVQVEVAPIKSSGGLKDRYLILFEEAAPAAPETKGGGRARTAAHASRVLQLKEDLAVSDEHLKSIIAEQEATNAQLKSANEELLSGNEELQSINEEFETAKEELESTNEELITSNDEVRQGNEALRRSNNDLTNLLANINIPIILLGPDLSIRLLTPAAEKELHIPRAEVGRSILHSRFMSHVPHLERTLRKVIRTADGEGLQVRHDGRWYQLWMRPYRTEVGAADGAVLAWLDIDAGKRTEKELRSLHARVVSAQELERKRLSRELHDGIGQMLSGVKFRLQSLPGESGVLPDTARRRITSATQVLDRAVAEIRRVSQDMMPSELEDLGLQPALRGLCREFNKRLGVPVAFRGAGAPKLVEPDLALTVFRIAQEALHNVGKHSRATRVAVSLSRTGRALKLVVSDNGRGCSGARLRMEGRRRGGLVNIRERAASIGGTADFDSKVGQGTRLVVRAPLDGAGRGRR
ncbi:MAG: histidine kinase [Elusimicrobia bacterium]|nr:histidine kinase [Elusimicrobiota bacterium]